jgi:uncharacterized membrane protein YeiB
VTFMTSPVACERTVSKKPGERILGYDLARSLAMLGMIVVHFGLVMSTDLKHPAWAAEVMHLLDGRAAALFVVLAGVGVTLMSRRAVGARDPRAISPARETLIRRGYFLFVIGYLNLIIWPGDILRVYGVSLAVAAGLIAATDLRLLSVSLGFVLGFVLLMILVDYEKNWDWSTMTYHRLWTAQGVVRNLFYDGFRSVFPWTGLLIFGMWLGRRDLRDRATNTKLLLIAAGTAVLAELVSWLCVRSFRAHPHGMDDETIQALFGTESMPPLPLFLLTSGGSAVAIIALCVRVADAWPSAIWLAPLVAMGQTALTWYLFHIIFGLGSVEAAGWTSSQPLPLAQACGVTFFAAAVFLSWRWKRRFRHGPLEWVMRQIAG